MRSEQDARKNPRPGDVFQKGRTWRKVIGFRNNYGFASAVVFTMRNGSRGRSSNYAFERWAADADVLHVQQEERDAA